MLGIRIIIASQDMRERKRIKEILFQNGYNIVAEYGDGNSLLRSVHQLEPNLIIIEENILFDNGLELAKSLQENARCPVLIFAHHLAAEKIQLLGEDWSFPLINKPIEENELLQGVKNTLSSYEELFKLNKSVAHLPRAEAEKILIGKAKLLLMERHKISEEEAYRKIQKVSMIKRKPKHIIAEAIILSYIYCYKKN